MNKKKIALYIGYLVLFFVLFRFLCPVADQWHNSIKKTLEINVGYLLLTFGIYVLFGILLGLEPLLRTFRQKGRFWFNPYSLFLLIPSLACTILVYLQYCAIILPYDFLGPVFSSSALLLVVLFGFSLTTVIKKTPVDKTE